VIIDSNGTAHVNPLNRNPQMPAQDHLRQHDSQESKKNVKERMKGRADKRLK
jgi:hypothetical protein